MNILAGLWEGIPVALGVWAGALAIGIVVGTVCSAALGSGHRMPRGIAHVWVSLFRGVPPLVVLFIFFFGIATGEWSPSAMGAAILGLGFVASAYLAVVFRESLDAVPTTQVEAAHALGVGRIDTLRFIMIPQSMPLIAASGGSYAIHLLKDTALASLIGVVDITYLANYHVERGANGITEFLVVGCIYLVMSLGIAVIARLIGARRTEVAAR
ncbi:amino acid ABC transporter permease [Gordonia rhizosphera]|uniref:Putative amino acid ABC transporter permease protein n=1 Tax=Gordonia rhizosphera NBRC 16068 TaxID=1108045 RepID=K6WGR2_9ACTN|nr:amino acid ABC transporter permease [Gordonia rhizosphera]GAB92966.1 putative amino acid ABC transporter permease protein [Gordonia rhizosphera NBRC 16068]